MRILRIWASCCSLADCSIELTSAKEEGEFAGEGEVCCGGCDGMQDKSNIDSVNVKQMYLAIL